jgi:hypothetical protein
MSARRSTWKYPNSASVDSGFPKTSKVSQQIRVRPRNKTPVGSRQATRAGRFARALNPGTVYRLRLRKPTPVGSPAAGPDSLTETIIPGELLCSKCASRTFGTALQPLDDGAQPQAQRFCDLVLAKGSQSKSRVFNATLTQRTACPTCVEAYAFIAVLSCILSSGQMPRAEPLTPEPSARCGRPGN